MPRAPFTLAVLNLFACLAPVPGMTDTESINAGHFSASSPGEQAPADWQQLIFKNVNRQTRYDLVRDGDTTVVRARSDASASGLVRKIDIDPGSYPLVRWRWKVNNVIAKSDVTSKQGDDYPARLYITFALDENKLGAFERVKYEAYRLVYGEYPPLAAISYVWDGKSPVGTMIPNAYTERVMMFVVESGAGRLEQWVEQERNIYKDYRHAFGEAPPPVSAVAIMTDSDNTRERAVAYYGDIVFSR